MECKSCKKDGAIVLLSGGQDSTTALYWAKKKWKNIKALSIMYGQRHWIELQSAKTIAKMAEVEHEELNLYQNTLRGGFLLESGEITAEYEGIAPTFVPARNLLFLAVAANRAYITGYYNIVIGVSQTDYSGYPDCREDFIRSFEDTIWEGTRRHIVIHTPLMHKTKCETVKLASCMLGCMEALAHSHTCYNGEFPPCGKCPACVLRAKGFKEAEIEDPLIKKTKTYK